MKRWTHAQLVSEGAGRHLASEAHLRVQVVSVPAAREPPPGELFSGYHGELLVLCLQGRCRVDIGASTLELDAHDQALLVDGEPFRILGTDADGALVQLIWTPGPTPCRACWESNGRFFSG
jgi:hypothetical protein